MTWKSPGAADQTANQPYRTDEQEAVYQQDKVRTAQHNHSLREAICCRISHQKLDNDIEDKDGILTQPDAPRGWSIRDPQQGGRSDGDAIFIWSRAGRVTLTADIDVIQPDISTTKLPDERDNEQVAL